LLLRGREKGEKKDPDECSVFYGNRVGLVNESLKEGWKSSVYGGAIKKKNSWGKLGAIGEVASIRASGEIRGSRWWFHQLGNWQ